MAGGSLDETDISFCVLDIQKNKHTNCSTSVSEEPMPVCFLHSDWQNQYDSDIWRFCVDYEAILKQSLFLRRNVELLKQMSFPRVTLYVPANVFRIRIKISHKERINKPGHKSTFFLLKFLKNDQKRVISRAGIHFWLFLIRFNYILSSLGIPTRKLTFLCNHFDHFQSVLMVFGHSSSWNDSFLIVVQTLDNYFNIRTSQKVLKMIRKELFHKQIFALGCF
jgi:hypothetical protein